MTRRNLSQQQLGGLRHVHAARSLNTDDLARVVGTTVRSFLLRGYLERFKTPDGELRYRLNPDGVAAMREYEDAIVRLRQTEAPLTQSCADLLRLVRLSRSRTGEAA